MVLRGVRGAIVAKEDSEAAILSATNEMLQALLAANPVLRSQDLAGALFTVTGDLISAYPAAAARKLGWTQVPLMCAQEIPVPGGLAHCIRVLLLWNTDLEQTQIHHVYLGEAARLRPDLSLEETFEI